MPSPRLPRLVLLIVLLLLHMLGWCLRMHRRRQLLVLPCQPRLLRLAMGLLSLLKLCLLSFVCRWRLHMTPVRPCLWYRMPSHGKCPWGWWWGNWW